MDRNVVAAESPDRRVSSWESGMDVDAFAQRLLTATDAERQQEMNLWRSLDTNGNLPSHRVAFDAQLLPATLAAFEKVLPKHYWRETNYNGVTPLHVACKYNNTLVVASIMKRIPPTEVVREITSLQGEQASILSIATLCGTEEIVTLLLNAIPRGAMLYKGRREYPDALAFAVKQGREDVFRAIFERTPVDSILREGGRHRSILTTTVLMENHALLKIQLECLSVRERSHRVAVMQATRDLLSHRACMEQVKELVTWMPEGDLAELDEIGQTVLHIAARQSPECVRFLLGQMPHSARYVADNNGMLAEELADAATKVAFQPIVKSAYGS